MALADSDNSATSTTTAIGVKRFGSRRSDGLPLTLATTDGLELLMHIGLDTVNLKGAGFEPVVKTGDQVKLGDPLIHFDVDYVATHAKSLLTMIVVTNGERVAGRARLRAGDRLRIGDPGVELALIAVDGRNAQETPQR